MIILDTNVVSELMKPVRDPNCESWCASHSDYDLFVSSITIAEILYGIELLPLGSKRTRLEQGATKLFETTFEDQVLSFDGAAAQNYASLRAAKRKAGMIIDILDMQIAAIALANGAAVATRNVRHFEDCGLRLIDPWLVQ